MTFSNDLGLALRDKGRLDEAIACYREALRLKPDFAGARVAGVIIPALDRWHVLEELTRERASQLMIAAREHQRP